MDFITNILGIVGTHNNPNRGSIGPGWSRIRTIGGWQKLETGLPCVLQVFGCLGGVMFICVALAALGWVVGIVF